MKQTYRLSSDAISIQNVKENPAQVLILLWVRIQLLFATLIQTLSPAQTRKVVVLGQGSEAQKLADFFQKGAWAYQFKGFFDLNKTNIQSFKQYCKDQNIDELYFAHPVQDRQLLAELSEFANKNFIYFRVANTEKPSTKVSSYYFDNVPVMALRQEPLASRVNQILKRAFDIVFSFCVLVVLVLFVFPIIAIAIKLESRGSVFFVQMRPGKKNVLFPCFKFRSMTASNDTEQQASKNDMRITKVGAFLRKTSLDELPQFANVLLGHMSVVGPRPNMQKQLEYYSTVIDNYSERHFVTPGITGWAQVNGFRGETNTIELMEKRVELDLQYMEKWSLWMDVKIIFRTAYNMVKGEEMAY
jgi:putative colanic acid biosynthesis UDP-glucose lipid carrier transferase